MRPDARPTRANTGQVARVFATRHATPKARLLTRGHLDGRSRARKQFDAIANGIAVDLGGVDRLTTVQKHLVEAFAGAALSVNDLNMKLLIGDDINILEQSTAISTLVRVAARLGTGRAAKDIIDPLTYASEPDL